MSYPGLFIALEGVDGCGAKTTQAKKLKGWLEQVFDREVVRTREPGGTNLGVTLRQLIQHGEDMDPRTEALLYAADRAHHVNSVIRPALARGAIVISDRYLDSSVAYQAVGRQLRGDQIEQLSLWAANGLLPDVTVLIDIDPRIANARQTGEPDRIEREGIVFQERVREGYLARVQAAPARWLVVPGDGLPNQVLFDIKAALQPRVSQLLTQKSSAPTNSAPTQPGIQE